MPAVSQLLTFTLKDESHFTKHELEVLQTVWRIVLWSAIKKRFLTENGKYLVLFCFPNTLSSHKMVNF